MSLQESIRKVLREETKSGKYISMLEDLTEGFKTEDCVCDIKIEYRPDQYTDAYIINVILGTIDLDDKFNGTPSSIRWYKHTLRRKITSEVIDYLPISFFVEFKTTPKCRKDLKESENKQSRLLSKIEEDGLYQVMQDTGLSMGQIILKYDNLPREVFERYIKDYLMNDAYDIPGSDGDIALSLVIELSEKREIESFYLSKGVVTAEINEYDSEGRIVAGSYEKLSNLTDKELFVIVDELSHLNDDYFDDM